jgi:UTP--glucose-1-phosphate uridylyltransferase
LLRMSTIVEKPGKADAPSNLASVSGYLFTPDIFEYLNRAKEDIRHEQEFYAQYGMQLMINDGKELLAYEVKNGKYYDTGNKLEYLKTVVDFALKHEDLKHEFAAHLKSMV